MKILNIFGTKQSMEDFESFLYYCKDKFIKVFYYMFGRYNGYVAPPTEDEKEYVSDAGFIHRELSEDYYENTNEDRIYNEDLKYYQKLDVRLPQDEYYKKVFISERMLSLPTYTFRKDLNPMNRKSKESIYIKAKPTIELDLYPTSYIY